MKLKRAAFKFLVSKFAYDQYQKDYNENKPSKEQLKAVHAEIMYEIFGLFGKKIKAIREMEDLAPAIDSNNLPHVHTNNVILGDRRKRSEATVYRAIKRLIDAQVITKKINHGRIRDYELVINPELLAVFDTLNPDFEQKIYRAEYEISYDAQISFCNLLYVSFKDTINNKETTRFTILKGVPAERLVMDNQKDTLNGNTAKHTENPNGRQKNIAPGENLSALEKKIKSDKRKITDLKFRIASYIVDLYISLMLKGFTIYDGERLNAIEIVEEHYLKSNNVFKLNSWAKEYRERLEMAHRYQLTKGDKYKSPFPAKYFSINNTKNGFRKTKVWLNQNDEYKRIKDVKKKIKADKIKAKIKQDKTNAQKCGSVAKLPKKREPQTEYQRLQNLIRRYNQAPTMQNFDLAMIYLKNNMPNMTESFIKQINTIR